MADASVLKREDARVLEHLRQRLITLADGIGALSHGNTTDALAILNRHVEAITDHLAQHADVLTRMTVYPHTNYPGRTQEHILTQLVAKKLSPDVLAWAEQGRKTWADVACDSGGPPEELDAIWTWAGDSVHEKVSGYIVRGDPYTAEERRGGIEHVNTGLSGIWFEEDDRDGDDEDEDDDDDDDDAELGDDEQANAARDGLAVTSVGTAQDGQVTMELAGIKSRPSVSGRSFEDILRFATGGQVPP